MSVNKKSKQLLNHLFPNYLLIFNAAVYRGKQELFITLLGIKFLFPVQFLKKKFNTFFYFPGNSTVSGFLPC